MKFFSKIKEYLGIYKKSILTVDNKNLTIGSKIALFFFILIIFNIIGGGVSIQKSYIQSPTKQFGYKCTSIVDKYKGIRDFETRDVNKDVYSNYYPYKYWKLRDFNYKKNRRSEYDILTQFGKNKMCQELGVHYLNVATDPDYKEKLLVIKALTTRLQGLKQSVKSRESQYSTALLEDIAKQDKNHSILLTGSKTAKNELINLDTKIDKIQTNINSYENIETLKTFQEFKKYLKENYHAIEEAHKNTQKYYRFQYTINVFFFLLPVWFIFYFGYKYYKRKKRYIISHLSVNVANVSALFIVYHIFTLIYQIIPKVFFAKLIAILSMYNFTVILNVLGILFFMGIFGFFIHRIQKNKTKDDKNESGKFQETIRQNRILKDICPDCGKNINFHESDYCGNCGLKIVKECYDSECKEKNYCEDNHCRKCGKYLKDTL